MSCMYRTLRGKNKHFSYGLWAGGLFWKEETTAYFTYNNTILQIVANTHMRSIWDAFKNFSQQWNRHLSQRRMSIWYFIKSTWRRDAGWWRDHTMGLWTDIQLCCTQRPWRVFDPICLCDNLTVQTSETKSVGMWNIWRQQQPAVWQRNALQM